MPFNPFHRCANLWSFLVLFSLCYFLETITYTYLVSAVQSIERQFQIPSRMSGSLVASSDIGYVITVVVLAYLGSKGNRARWIGGGTLLIAIASLIVALPTFVFPSKQTVHDTGELLKGIFEPLTHDQISTPHKFLQTMWARQLPSYVQDDLNATGYRMFENIMDTPSTDGHHGLSGITMRKMGQSPNDNGLKLVKRQAPNITVSDSTSSKVRSNITEAVLLYTLGFDSFETFASRMYDITNDPMVIRRIMQSAGLPFGFCRNASMLVKSRMKVAKCRQQEGEGGNRAAFAMVFIGIMLIGVGHSMPWTLGMPMIDDNVKKEKTPYYFAGVFFVRIMGPVVGFMLGAICSKLYVTLKSPPMGITPLDPRWIGAWWLGFLVVFAALTVPSILLMCFPRFETKQSAKNGVTGKNNRTPKQVKNGDTSLIPTNDANAGHYTPKEKVTLMQELKGFGRSLAQILRSPVYTGSLIGRLFDAFAFKGYFTFKPKYLENHYGITQFKSSIYMGIMGVAGYAGGVVIGSLLMRKGRMEGRKAAFYVGACSLIAAILSFVQVFLGCHSVVNQVGQIGMRNGNASDPTWPTCYGCNCDAAGLYPVCSKDGTPYYSPCHAGCTNFTYERVGLEVNFQFDKCYCTGNGTGQLSRQWCKDDCQTPFIISFILSSLGGIISGSAVIPGVLIVIRSVAKEHRSVALGFSGFVVSLISTFPSPPVYGLIIDTACIVWNTACGGDRGSCQIYDPTKLRHRIYIFHGALRFTALLFDVWVWYFAKNLKLMEEEESRREENELEPRAQAGHEHTAFPISPSFAKEIEEEVKGLQVEGNDVLTRKLSI